MTKEYMRPSLDPIWRVGDAPENEWTNLVDERDRLRDINKELLAALENLATYDRVERPAFRAKPEGAPGSTARIQQAKLIALEDAARAAIFNARSVK